MAHALRRLEKLFQSPLAYLNDSRHLLLRRLGKYLLVKERERLLKKGASLSDVKVTVIMTAYNTGLLIEAAVRSVMAQSHPTLELMVIDDASTDNTPDVLKALSEEFETLKVYRSPKNHGTYWSKNWCMKKASGDYIAFHDSDDTSDPDRIRIQLAATAEKRGVIASTVQWQRILANGDILTISGRQRRMAAISLMIKKDPIVTELGYFDSVRISADSEYLKRFVKIMGRSRIYHLQHHLYTGLLRDGSLTTGESSGMRWNKQYAEHTRINPEVHGDRKEYMESAKAWHEKLSTPSGLRDAYIEFPQNKRCLKASKAMLEGCDDQDLDQVVEIS